MYRPLPRRVAVSHGIPSLTKLAPTSQDQLFYDLVPSLGVGKATK
jgi:hypothetical protein